MAAATGLRGRAHRARRTSRRIPAEEVVVGDFASVPADIDLLVAGSPRRSAPPRVLGVPLFETGFPRFEVFGASRERHARLRGRHRGHRRDRQPARARERHITSRIAPVPDHERSTA